MNEVREMIRSYIIDNFLFGEEEGMQDSTSFLKSGIINSTGVLELINFIEEQFKVKMNDEELIPENLDSVGNILEFLGRKLGGAKCEAVPVADVHSGMPAGS
jgi:acyl carrier protein